MKLRQRQLYLCYPNTSSVQGILKDFPQPTSFEAVYKGIKELNLKQEKMNKWGLEWESNPHRFSKKSGPKETDSHLPHWETGTTIPGKLTQKL